MFDEVIRRATALLHGEDLLPEEADEQRQRLLAGFRWILVDEYQDIDGAQYDLISALAGRTREDEDGKLTLFAVGDDDQNIYAFNGASVEFIRRFEADYGPKPAYLIGNYRSTAPHRRGGQRGDRAGAGADEGRAPHPYRQGAHERTRRAERGKHATPLRRGGCKSCPRAATRLRRRRW